MKTILIFSLILSALVFVSIIVSGIDQGGEITAYTYTLPISGIVSIILILKLAKWKK